MPSETKKLMKEIEDYLWYNHRLQYDEKNKHDVDWIVGHNTIGIIHLGINNYNRITDDGGYDATRITVIGQGDWSYICPYGQVSEISISMKRRRVAKDKSTGIPKKYLSGTKGGKRSELASVIKQISRLYKAGARIPQSLINRRIKLGKKKQNIKSINTQNIESKITKVKDFQPC